MKWNDDHSGQLACAHQPDGRWFVFDAIRGKTLVRDLPSRAAAALVIDEMLEGL